MLRGPQGTLFGRNTPAGIVKVESARPTWEWEGYGRVSYGRFDSVNFEGALSGPLIPSVLAARASLLVQRRSDWIDNTYTGKTYTRKNKALGGYDDIAGRVQFVWTPVENFSGRFKVHVRDFDSNARVFRRIYSGRAAPVSAQGYGATKLLRTPAIRSIWRATALPPSCTIPWVSSA